MSADAELLYLNIANVALGVVALVCVLIVVGSALREIIWRVRGRDTFPAPFEKNGFVIPGLGTTIDDRRPAGDDGAPPARTRLAEVPPSARGRTAA
jgi:hypothetical protein